MLFLLTMLLLPAQAAAATAAPDASRLPMLLLLPRQLLPMLQLPLLSSLLQPSLLMLCPCHCSTAADYRMAGNIPSCSIARAAGGKLQKKQKSDSYPHWIFIPSNTLFSFSFSRRKSVIRTNEAKWNVTFGYYRDRPVRSGKRRRRAKVPVDPIRWIAKCQNLVDFIYLYTRNCI